MSKKNVCPGKMQVDYWQETYIANCVAGGNLFKRPNPSIHECMQLNVTDFIMFCYLG